MTQFRPAGAAVTAEARRQSERTRSNERVLAERWAGLLADHPLEWVAVFGDGTVVVASTLHGIAEALPLDQRGSAIVRYIVDDKRPRLL